MFSCEFGEIFKNTFSYRTLLVAASRLCYPIPEMMKGYSIDFLENPYQTRSTPNAKSVLAQEILMEQEINELLEKGAI